MSGTRRRFLPALVAIAVVTALVGCGGSSPGPANNPAAGSTPADNPGAGRKPASGAWLAFRYGEWKVEGGSTATERYFARGAAYGQSAQRDRSYVMARIVKGSDADVRTHVTTMNGGKEPTDADRHGEAWCVTGRLMCYVQLNGGHIELVGTNATTADVAALGTTIYADLSDDPNAPEPTSDPTPENPGADRKPAAGKVLPATVGQWGTSGVHTDGFARYSKPGATTSAEGSTVMLSIGDLDARSLASMGARDGAPAEQHDKAWCAEIITRAVSTQCYVQLNGGVLQVLGGEQQPSQETAALANALYDAL